MKSVALYEEMQNYQKCAELHYFVLIMLIILKCDNINFKRRFQKLILGEKKMWKFVYKLK